jgi:hypothetical protein
MPCVACGCACSSGDQTPREELDPPLLLDIETDSGHIKAAAEAKKGRIATFIVWVRAN